MLKKRKHSKPLKLKKDHLEHLSYVKDTNTREPSDGACRKLDKKVMDLKMTKEKYTEMI